MEISDKFIKLAYDILAIILPVLAAVAAEYIRRLLGIEKIKRLKEELSTKQELATLAVRFVQQVYKDLDGPEKYRKAAEWLTAEALQLGLKITPEEMKGLIESSLRVLKDSFGEEWAKTTKADKG